MKLATLMTTLAGRCPPRALATALVLLAALAGRGPAAALPPSPVLCDDPVATRDGAIRGEADGEATCRYLGIPYAAPPVEDLRWRPPAPAIAWSGIRDATHFAPHCAQKSVMEVVNFDPAREGSEDCLTVNVWRPRTPGPHPVMVWYHGGGLYGGTANTPMYHSAPLATAGDVVVVTVNYRLAVFGYLATPGLAAEDPHGSAGNYGLLDQVAALRWVRENAAAFGGDPDNVTIFGESAGGWSVCSLLTTPLSAGLFHKAIMESGGCNAVTSMERGFEVGARVAEALGCAPEDTPCMRAAPAGRVLRRGVQFELKGFEWMPRIDGWVVPAAPVTMIREGAYHKVPFLAGANRDEVKVAVAFSPSQYLDGAEGYERRLVDKFGADAAPAIEALYDLGQYRRPAAAYRQMFTEVALLCPTFRGVSTLAEGGTPAWLYRFDFDRFRFGRLVGAAHGMELPFVFGTLDRLPVFPLYGWRQRAAAWELSQAMMAYWTRFAHAGDPNVPGLPEWPSFTRTGEVMHLDEELRAEPLSPELGERCAYWDEHTRTHPWIVESMGITKGKPGRSVGSVSTTLGGAAP